MNPTVSATDSRVPREHGFLLVLRLSRVIWTKESPAHPKKLVSVMFLSDIMQNL
jgi:hypothetical protein